MKSNYPYPKDEMEFYSRNYSVDQLIKNYDYQNLMSYYIFGLNMLNGFQKVIDDKCYGVIDRTPDEVFEDKMHFVLRTQIVKNAITKMDTCEILPINNIVFLFHLN
jgi:hypothetical protein